MRAGGSSPKLPPQGKKGGSIVPVFKGGNLPFRSWMRNWGERMWKEQGKGKRVGKSVGHLMLLKGRKL